ncbi:benzoate 4-monooxygenase cytochrome P450 [Fusarium tjaetaba]|uniref:Benzoate 4-monooxygenase cytochrome P450 n=1 Tax=Fusarium tjaetaba TaxID=1567544 RepID=A0A8H5W115_9HYPO|nr:benzoate 4-monooxygenase cytochrome P450 [Fusarium tjaetaba]KAF5641705.1 benzoate 4-monooxygenase cytochrome P450 [Fusarium tjaetaba]
MLSPSEHTLLYALTIQALFFTLAVVFIVLIYAWLAYLLGNGSLRHVPGPWYCKVSSIPLSICEILCRRNDVILGLHKKYGPIVQISPNEVSVADFEATKQIYGTKDRWAKSDYFDHFMGYGRRSIFATKPYEDHRIKRKYISSFYQAKTIYKLPEIEKHVKSRSLAMLDQVRNGEDVDVLSLTSWYALDNITFLVFGPTHRTYAVDQTCTERGILEGLKYQQFVGPLRYRCPRLYNYASLLLQKVSSRLRNLSIDEELPAWCQKKFFAALKDPQLHESHSLVRHLWELREDDAHEGPIDVAYMAAEVLDNIDAAEATIAVTATYLIWKLTEVPEWQDKIRQELSALPKQDDGYSSFVDIDTRVPSLEACLREVYRMHPSSSGKNERVVPLGGRTLAGVFVPEHTIVTSSVLALHYDGEVYSDPDRFLPGRWIDGSEDQRKVLDAQLIPFGYGGRICLGKALATMELKLLIASLYLEHESVATLVTNAESMKQCSTHDAVPRGLKCVVRFRKMKDNVALE